MAGAAAVGGREPPMGVPHSAQNFALAGTVAPQVGQPWARPPPHSMQNLAAAGFSVPHVAQITGPGVPLVAWTRA